MSDVQLLNRVLLFVTPWTCFFDDPVDVGNLIYGSSIFSKSNLNIWKFMIHVLLKPGLENFEHYFASVWDECNFVVIWTFFGIAFLWDWNENWPLILHNSKEHVYLSLYDYEPLYLTWNISV